MFIQIAGIRPGYRCWSGRGACLVDKLWEVRRCPRQRHWRFVNRSIQLSIAQVTLSIDTIRLCLTSCIWDLLFELKMRNVKCFTCHGYFGLADLGSWLQMKPANWAYHGEWREREREIERGREGYQRIGFMLIIAFRDPLLSGSPQKRTRVARERDTVETTRGRGERDGEEDWGTKKRERERKRERADGCCFGTFDCTSYGLLVFQQFL